MDSIKNVIQIKRLVHTSRLNIILVITNTVGQLWHKP